MRAHRQISAFCIGMVLMAGSIAMAAEDIPTPSVSRIDYSHPEKYLDVFPSFGNVEKIRQIGSSLRSGSAEHRIAAIDLLEQATARTRP